MPDINPVQTTSTIRSRTTISSGGILRDTLDLRSNYGADVFVNVGRQASTAYGSNAPLVVVRPTWGNQADRSPIDLHGRMCNGTAANATTLSGSVTAGDLTIPLTSATGYAAGQIIAIDTANSLVEWARISKISGTTVTLDEPLLRSHSGTVNVRNYADCFIIPLPGKRLYEIIVDYGDSSSGSDLDVVILANIYQKDTIS